MKGIFSILIFHVLFFMAIMAVAQKGTGSLTGIARQSGDPEILQVSCNLKEVATGPCAFTTGRSNSGTHLIVFTDDNYELNIHLGPTPDVAYIVKNLVPGQKIHCKVFRTSKLPDDNFIAIELETDNTFYMLRDQNLRPVWAGKGIFK
jgi:hypothetical protein